MTTVALVDVPRKLSNLKFYKLIFCRNMSVNSNSAHKLKQLFTKSVISVHPGTLLQNQVKLNDSRTLRVCSDDMSLGNRKVRVLGFGKAVLGMAEAMDIILGDLIRDGVLIAPTGSLKSSRYNISKKFIYMEGALNNISDKNSIEATKKALSYVRALNENDLLLVLISGGGSALLSLPVDGLDFKEKANLIRDLADRGARIDQMNVVRKKLSAVKGGRLAQAAHPAQVVALTLSDVIGDRLDVIASGPTVPNTDSKDAAKNIIEQFAMQEKLSPTVRNFIYDTDDSNNISTDNTNWISNSKTYIIGNNRIAAQTAAAEAKLMGYEASVFCSTVQGDVEQLSKVYVTIAQVTYSFMNNKMDMKKYLSDLHEICQKAKKESSVQITMPQDLDLFVKSWHDCQNGVMLIFAGEPTVQVNKNAKGIGGRSQHLSLLFSRDISKITIGKVWLLCGGTDGADGPTDAAGAIACSELAWQSSQDGLDIDDAITKCNSYKFLSQFHDGERLIRTGPTGTNVMDLHFLLIQKDS